MLRVGIVGAGGMGRVHADCWSKIDDIKIQVICDIEVDKAESLAKIYNADVTTSSGEVIKRSDIDIVDICTPTPFHADDIISSLRSGKHTICEKPITRTLESAREVVKTAREVDVKFMVAHVLRFFPEFATAKNLIESGAIGIPRMARMRRGGPYPAGKWNDWYAKVEMSGGCLVDTGIHDFDFLRWIFGDAERVYASALTWKNIPYKDYGLATIRFKSRAMAQVEITWAHPSGTPLKAGFELIGTQGMLTYDNYSSTSLRVMRVGETNNSFSMESPVAESPYLTEIRHFVSCIKEDREPLITPEDAYRALEIALACIESARTNRPVSVGGEI